MNYKSNTCFFVKSNMSGFLGEVDPSFFGFSGTVDPSFSGFSG